MNRRVWRTGASLALWWFVHWSLLAVMAAFLLVGELFGVADDAQSFWGGAAWAALVLRLVPLLWVRVIVDDDGLLLCNGFRTTRLRFEEIDRFTSQRVRAPRGGSLPTCLAVWPRGAAEGRPMWATLTFSARRHGRHVAELQALAPSPVRVTGEVNRAWWFGSGRRRRVRSAG